LSIEFFVKTKGNLSCSPPTATTLWILLNGRTDGAWTAADNLTSKLAVVGPAKLVVVLLSSAGFNADLPVQSARAIGAINFLLGWAPAMLTVFFLNIGEDMARMTGRRPKRVPTAKKVNDALALPKSTSPPQAAKLDPQKYRLSNPYRFLKTKMKMKKFNHGGLGVSRRRRLYAVLPQPPIRAWLPSRAGTAVGLYNLPVHNFRNFTFGNTIFVKGVYPYKILLPPGQHA
jgi:hypothetical protein